MRRGPDDPITGERGLQAPDIGLVLAATTVVRVIAGPLVAHVADRLHRHTLFLCGCALLAALATVSLLLASALAGLLGIALLHAAVMGPIVPISDGLAATAAQTSERGAGRHFDYAGGSAAFALGTLASGWQAGATGMAAAMSISGALLAPG